MVVCLAKVLLITLFAPAYVCTLFVQGKLGKSLIFILFTVALAILYSTQYYALKGIGPTSENFQKKLKTMGVLDLCSNDITKVDIGIYTEQLESLTFEGEAFEIVYISVLISLGAVFFMLIALIVTSIRRRKVSMAVEAAFQSATTDDAQLSERRHLTSAGQASVAGEETSVDRS